MVPSPSSGWKLIGDCSVAVDIFACRAAGLLSCYWIGTCCLAALQRGCNMMDEIGAKRWPRVLRLQQRRADNAGKRMLRLLLADSLCSAPAATGTATNRQGWRAEVKRGSTQHGSVRLHAIEATPPRAGPLPRSNPPLAGVRLHAVR